MNGTSCNLFFFMVLCWISSVIAKEICGKVLFKTYSCEEGLRCCKKPDKKTYNCCPPEDTSSSSYNEWYIWVGVVVLHFLIAAWIIYRYRHRKAKHVFNPVQRISEDQMSLVDNRQDINEATHGESSPRLAVIDSMLAEKTVEAVMKYN